MEEENKEPSIISINCRSTSSVVSRLFTGNTASLVGFVYFISESIRNKTKNKAKAHISGESKVHRGKNAADYGRFTLDFDPIGLLVTVIGPAAGESQL